MQTETDTSAWKWIYIVWFSSHKFMSRKFCSNLRPRIGVTVCIVEYVGLYEYINPLTPELKPSAQRCLTRFLLGILLLEPCISLTYAWKANKYTNYSFSLLIMYCSSYMFRHYIVILRERS
jgi:hypothetical protein